MTHVVLGATGHVGSALVSALLAQGEEVTAVTRGGAHAEALARQGANIAEADVFDVPSLRRVVAGGKRLFLLNPPAPPSTDTAAEEQRSLDCILEAIEGLPLEKIVAESTYGAQRCERCGDLGILYELEQALRARPIPASVIRAAYYMSNWDASLASARERGVVQSFFPADFKLPMVAPRDLGVAAAELLTQPAAEVQTLYVEGPRGYSAADVAVCLASALGRPVEVEVVPRERWTQSYRELGFSERAAESYAGMTALTLDALVQADDPWRGQTTLREYIDALVERG